MLSGSPTNACQLSNQIDCGTSSTYRNHNSMKLVTGSTCNAIMNILSIFRVKIKEFSLEEVALFANVISWGETARINKSSLLALNLIHLQLLPKFFFKKLQKIRLCACRFM